MCGLSFFLVNKPEVEGASKGNPIVSGHALGPQKKLNALVIRAKAKFKKLVSSADDGRCAWLRSASEAV